MNDRARLEQILRSRCVFSGAHQLARLMLAQLDRKETMTLIKCNTCQFFNLESPADDVGECCRHAPRTISRASEHWENYRVFPIVDPNDGCGEGVWVSADIRGQMALQWSAKGGA